MRTSSFITRFASGAAALLATGSALAHAGHGRVALDTLQRSITHWLTEPEHVASIVAVLVAVAAVALLRRRRGSQR